MLRHGSGPLVYLGSGSSGARCSAGSLDNLAGFALRAGKATDDALPCCGNLGRSLLHSRSLFSSLTFLAASAPSIVKDHAFTMGVSQGLQSTSHSIYAPGLRRPGSPRNRCFGHCRRRGDRLHTVQLSYYARARIVQMQALAARLVPKRYAGQSLRASFVTAANRARVGM